MNSFKKYISIVGIITFAVWGSCIHIVNLPGIGSLYPLRIILLIYIMYLFYRLIRIKDRSIYARSDFCLFMFWLYMMIVTLVNEKWDSTISSAVAISTTLIMISLIFRVVSSEKERKAALLSIILNAFVLYIMALYENKTGQYLFSQSIVTVYNYNAYGSLQPKLFFGNTNNLCMFLCLTVPCVYLLTKRISWRILWLGIPLHISLLSSCRTGIVLVFIMFTFMFISKIRFDFRVKLLGVLMFFTAGILFMFYNPALNNRIYIWANTLLNCCNSFFIGTGIGSSKYINSENALFHVSKAFINGGAMIGAVHNYILELLLETGIIGISILAIWLKRPLKTIMNRRYDSEGAFYYLLLIILFLASLCASNMTQWYQFWIFLPLVLSFAYDPSYDKYDNYRK